MKRNLEYDAEITRLVKEHPHSYINMLHSKGFTNGKANGCVDRQHLLQYIIDMTPCLNDPEYTYALKTRVYWLINHIESWKDPRVRCAVCGNPFEKIDIVNIIRGYNAKTCSKDCARKLAMESTKKTLLDKYGVENSFLIPEVVEILDAKRPQTFAKAQNTRIERYGSPNNTKKAQDTKKKKYGSVWNQDKVDETHLKRYGQKHWNNPAKNFETKKKNGTLSTSKPEDESYELLCVIFGEDDVVRQYKSDKYPFACDFYIKSRDIYIECNFSWTHGGHWFDSSSVEDQATVELWKSRGTRYYKNAISTWTVRDVKKRTIAEENKLNYLVFWTLEELKAFDFLTL